MVHITMFNLLKYGRTSEHKVRIVLFETLNQRELNFTHSYLLCLLRCEYHFPHMYYIYCCCEFLQIQLYKFNLTYAYVIYVYNSTRQLEYHKGLMRKFTILLGFRYFML